MIRTINKIIIWIASLLISVSCIDLSPFYSRYAKTADINDATFEVSNQTGRDIVYRHVSYIGSFSLYSIPEERSVIECTIPSGKTEVVGYSYWKYNKIPNDNLESLFNSIYVGEVKDDTGVTILNDENQVLVSWKPGDEKEFNIFDASHWTASKTIDGEHNEYIHYKWSIVLNDSAIK